MFSQVKDSLPEPARKAALQSLLAAEGSDWFWWYGPEFQIEDKPLFDDLFRRHVRCAYRAMGRPVPPAVDKSLLTVGPVRAYQEPRDFITPTIDGRRTSYYEWLGAGVYRGGAGQHAMAKSADLVKEIWFGFDKANFYFCLQWTGTPPLPGGDAVGIRFSSPANAELWIGDLRTKTGKAVSRELRGDWPRKQTADGRTVEAAHDKMLEVSVPLEFFGLKPGERLGFSVCVENKGHAQEQHPSEGEIEIKMPDAAFSSQSWLV